MGARIDRAGSPDAPENGEQNLEERLSQVQRDLANQLRIVQAIGQSSPDFTYIFDVEYRFIYASPPLLKLWGKTLQEVVGKNFQELGYPPDLVELHRRQLEKVMATGKPVSGANTYVSPEGVQGEFEYTFVPVFGDDGRIESIAGTTRDTTDKLRLERERAAALAELQDREEQLRQFADAIPQLAWIAHADGHISWYNRRWYEYTGTSLHEMQGWGWEKVHHPEHRARVVTFVKEAWTTAEAWELTFPLRSRDGEWRWFLTRAVPIRDANGTLVKWFGTNTDIEAQRQAIAGRDAALAAANEAGRAKDEFLAMLGHELRNPLSPIVTALKLLQMRGAVSREHEVIQRQVDHLSRLVDDLLDVARITQGKIDLRRERLEIAAVVLRALEMTSPLLERRGQRVSLDVPAEGLLVSADPDRFAQVVSNLLTNASKFSGAGAEISVAAERAGDAVRIRVGDRGVGIAPEMLDRIFQSFVQQRQAIDRASGGLGLGLSIVKNLVELHGGTVYARSDGPGRGSEFVVELPALAAATSSPAARADDRPGQPSRRGRVLVVDDNQDAADLLAEFLSGLGFEVRVAHDPPAALEAAAQFRPEIALLDIGLPVMDGWELGRRLRDLDGSGQPRLIAVTGYGQDRDRGRSTASGFAGHLIKPVDLGALTKLVCA